MTTATVAEPLDRAPLIISAFDQQRGTGATPLAQAFAAVTPLCE